MQLQICLHVQFQSTHPVWGGTGGLWPPRCSPGHFNPPTPCGVGRLHIHLRILLFIISIHPPRVGWDAKIGGLAAQKAKISIHPPRVGWDRTERCQRQRRSKFQSTHPVWGGTFTGQLYPRLVRGFQSTHPVWGGTLCTTHIFYHFLISIHPPRVGWDSKHS